MFWHLLTTGIYMCLVKRKKLAGNSPCPSTIGRYYGVWLSWPWRWPRYKRPVRPEALFLHNALNGYASYEVRGAALSATTHTWLARNSSKRQETSPWMVRKTSYPIPQDVGINAQFVLKNSLTLYTLNMDVMGTTNLCSTLKYDAMKSRNHEMQLILHRSSSDSAVEEVATGTSSFYVSFQIVYHKTHFLGLSERKVWPSHVL